MPRPGGPTRGERQTTGCGRGIWYCITGSGAIGIVLEKIPFRGIIHYVPARLGDGGPVTTGAEANLTRSAPGGIEFRISMPSLVTWS